MIWGYPRFRKPPYICTKIYCHICVRSQPTSLDGYSMSSLGVQCVLINNQWRSIRDCSSYITYILVLAIDFHQRDGSNDFFSDLVQGKIHGVTSRAKHLYSRVTSQFCPSKIQLQLDVDPWRCERVAYHCINFIYIYSHTESRYSHLYTNIF